MDEGGAAALKQVLRFMSPARRRQFGVVLALMLLGAVAELVTVGAVLPFLTLLADPGGLADLPLAGRLLGGFAPGDRLFAATVFLVAAALGAGAVRLQLAWSSQRFVYRLGHEVSVEIQRRVLAQPYSWHVAHNSREIVASLEKVQIMSSAVALQFMQSLTAAVLAFFIVAALVAIDAVTALASAGALALLYFAVSIGGRRLLGRNSRTVASAFSERVGLVQESLGGIRDVIVDNAQGVYLEAFRKVDADYSRARAANSFIGSAPRFVIEAAGIVIIAAAALMLAGREGGFAAALPVLGALALGAQRLLPLVQQIYFAWTSIRGNRKVTDDILRLLALPAPDADEGEAAPPLPLTSEIRIEGVRFTYPGRGEPALDDVSLTIAKGARAALVGTTGSGKSTLADIVMGLIEPDEGRITIDGTPLTGPVRAAWRRSIGHVSQSVFLADSSIARNIAFGTPPHDIDRVRVIEAARLARLHDFIESLPEGYDTRAGERGVALSGGQRQRLGLARALYKGAPVLVLDEATSALDETTEAEVLESLEALSASRGLTIFMIAHRLHPAFRCDLVVRLEKGRIAS
ncbi:MAG TPA: ABC transporter ATP-binding protein [Allosphingosinicella sp.]|nr:ABC transporter ATP-binding protein [Allosphingosinicella sp.]